MHRLYLSCLFWLVNTLTASESVFSFFSDMPRIAYRSMQLSMSEDSWYYWFSMVGSTGVLYYYDESLLLKTQAVGRSWGSDNLDHTKTLIHIGKIPIFRGPTDIGSALYFLGDGWTHFAISSSFYISGFLLDDNRAIQTGKQILQGMIVSTLPNQLIKRTTGRESPDRRSKPRGAWRPFPSISDYNASVPKYDAMPSGHIMTSTLTITIMSLNYPEYRFWIQTIGYSLMTILGLQMMNNGVHWASDYPLGIAMGYVIGKSVVEESKSTKENYSEVWRIYPMISDFSYGIRLSRLF